MPKIGDKSFDVRLISRFIHQGEMRRADYDKYLKSLPDDADNMIETHPGDVDYEAEQSALLEQKKAQIQAAKEAAQS